MDRDIHKLLDAQYPDGISVEEFGEATGCYGTLRSVSADLDEKADGGVIPRDVSDRILACYIREAAMRVENREIAEEAVGDAFQPAASAKR